MSRCIPVHRIRYMKAQDIYTHALLGHHRLWEYDAYNYCMTLRGSYLGHPYNQPQHHIIYRVDKRISTLEIYTSGSDSCIPTLIYALLDMVEASHPQGTDNLVLYDADLDWPLTSLYTYYRDITPEGGIPRGS